ncbi:MAG TPA: GH1 family beta-glucosidase [Anaeromyxobacteraceae bacterium]|nr:GH1 family beta-glucosidase [Anaeromyxobacteraceae bacterium]
MNPEDPFPRRFLWGAGTSAYQVEGSPLADGAGPSIWHRFAHTPGTIRDGDTGDVACDQYHRFRDDVALMRELGLTAYRFSIAWPRVLPAGTGALNPKALDHYERLVDELLASGIEPMATLYHWDLPAALDDRGGWLNPDVAGWFAEYSRAVFRRLDDRVRLWATLNEPWVVADGGYLHGVLAPGHRSPYEAPRASHNLLRAHAAAVAAYRAEGRHQIGLVVNLEPKHPASTGGEDVEATRRADAYMNRQYLEPSLRGRYPEELEDVFGEAWPGWSPEDVAGLRTEIDFLGVNYYTRSLTRADAQSWPLRAAAVRREGATYTETGWEVYPAGLAETLSWVKERYGDVPLYVTENGAAFPDPSQARDTGVDDPLRVAYLREHLRAVQSALAAGCDVRGYFVWSLLDNLEWAHGFSKRFGIVHVDFATQRRTPKSSARYYAGVAASNGRVL